MSAVCQEPYSDMRLPKESPCPACTMPPSWGVALGDCDAQSSAAWPGNRTNMNDDDTGDCRDKTREEEEEAGPLQQSGNHAFRMDGEMLI